MKAIILVAGYATRLYPLTLNTPKALLPIAGRPIIDYILDEINTIEEITGVYAVTNSKFYGQFADWAKNAVSKIPVEVLDDGTSTEEGRLGAIGDIKFTLEQGQINEDVVIIAGDNFFTYKLKAAFDLFNEVRGDVVVAKEIDDVEQLKQFAVAKLDGDGRIIELVEKPENPESNIAVFATYFYRKETLPLISQYLADGNKKDAPGYFVQWLYTKYPVYAYRMEGNCFDIGTKKAYDDICNIVKP